MMTQDQFQLAAAEVIEKTLPGFFYSLAPYDFLGHKLVRVKIAASDYCINGVPDQLPQDVMLTFDATDQELMVHHPCISRNPDPNHPRERYLAMCSERVPFRTPKKGRELEAITRFCQRYKALLKHHYAKGAEDSHVANCTYYKTIGIVDQYIVYSINTGLYHHLREIKLKNVYLKEYFK